jgi:hypothetical protein
MAEHAASPMAAAAARVPRAAAFPALTLAVLLAGCLLRLAGAGRPLDYRSLALWHEADYTEIARNFAREGMNPLYPRIDWRGDSSGKVEMELPAIPWLAAVAARTLGAGEGVMRWLSAACSIASLLLFAGLARRALPAGAALFANAAFALSPLPIYLATTMQPESAMLLLVLLAASAIWRWYEQPASGRLLAACAALAAAILEKQPAASLGLMFAWLILRRRGLAALRDGRILAGAAIALVPPLAWYAWAWRFWAIDGNSLGLSDESHLIGSDVLLRRGILGNALFEVRDVFTPLGVVLALAGLRWAWRRLEPAVAWYASALVFYWVTARTSGAGWAFYYHCLSAAPACLLMGAGVAAWRAPADVAAAAAAARPFRPPSSQAALPFQEQPSAALPSPVPAPHAVPSPLARRLAATLAWLLPALTLASLAAVALYRLAERDGVAGAARTEVAATRARALCAARFKAEIPADGRIAVRGLDSRDEGGHLIAGNDPTFFAFADRKGFVYEMRPWRSTRTAHPGIAGLQGLARRGARYWIVAEPDLASPLLGRAEVDRAFTRLDTCPGGYALYDLQRRPEARVGRVSGAGGVSGIGGTRGIPGQPPPPSAAGRSATSPPPPARPRDARAGSRSPRAR